MPNSTIFYVDDDADDLAIFTMAARSLYLKTCVFNKGEKMLHALLDSSEIPSIIFIDINMPVMSGYDVINALKKITAIVHIPIVVLTTAGNDATIEKCRKMGVDYFIQKPTDLGYLMQAISYVASMDWNKHDSAQNFIHKYAL